MEFSIDFYRNAELVSLFLTNSSIYMFACLLILWTAATWKILERGSALRTASDLMILGVSISYLGSLLDNVYWASAWTASYKNLAIKNVLFKNGVLANIPFRNIPGIISSFLHIRAFYVMLEDATGGKVKDISVSLLLQSFVFSAAVTASIYFFL